MVIQQFIKLTLTELKLIRREPVAVFFIFIFPVFLLLLRMEVLIPVVEMPKEIAINYMTPALIVFTITVTALFSISQTIVSYRQLKFLKRLKGSPVRALTILSGLSFANFVATLFGIALLVGAAILVYEASFPENFISFLVGFILVFLSLTAIFLFISAVARSERMALAISLILFLPVMFFSGVFVPLDMLPEWIAQYISPYLPVTYAVELLQGLWLGTPLADLTWEAFILLGVLFVGLIIAAYTFRWE